MNNILKGKKLLILGATPSEVELIKRAHEFGVYVIVTDNNTDRNISVAKNYADEAWDISWSDLDALENKCRESGVDGVTAGWSEFRVENTIKLCERLGLPCYCTLEQLEITRNKRLFKEECILNGVPVVNEYKTPEEVTSFPVILKPVDRAGSIGIGVATNKEELDKAYKYAMDMSVCKDVIIEDYITDAVKIDSYYIIMDGEIVFVSTDDVINAKNNGTDKVIQSGWVLPSRRHAMYAEKVDPAIRRMIEHMGIKNGYIFFSGFANDKGYFAMFEAGFRLCGGYLHNYFEKKGIVNNFDIFIFHALTGSVKDVIWGKDKAPELKCATVNLYAKAGTIAKIEGFDKVAEIENCDFVLQKAHIGEKCTDDKAILTKIGMYYFCDESAEALNNSVEKAYEMINVIDENGEDMLFDRIDSGVVAKCWE